MDGKPHDRTHACKMVTNRLGTFEPSHKAPVPNAVLDKQRRNPIGIIMVVAIRTVLSLQHLDRFHIFEPLQSLFERLHGEPSRSIPSEFSAAEGTIIPPTRCHWRPRP